MRKRSSYKLYTRKNAKGQKTYYYDIPASISGCGRIRESCYTDDRDKAHTIASKKVKELDDTKIYGKKPTIGLLEAMTAYWDQHVQFLKSAGNSVQFHCKRFLSYFGDAPLGSIGTEELRKYRMWRKAQYVNSSLQAPKGEKASPRLISNSTFNRELAAFQKMHRIARDEWGVEVGAIDFKALKLPEKDKNVTFLNEEQIEQIISFAPDHLKSLVQFCFMTGVRRSNATMLNVNQIDFINRTITFKVKSKRPEGKIIYFPIYDELYSFLEEIKPSKDGYMFTYRGKPIERPTKALVRACEAAGIYLPRGQKMHVIRHSTATYLLNKGVAPHVVQQILGHSSITTTMGYTHVLDKNKKEALNYAFTAQIRHKE